MTLPPTFDARLVRARKITPHVRELVFEREDGLPFDFVAGQWVSLVLPHDSGELRRAYSIASAPNGTPAFEIAVTHVEGGPGSTYLHAIEPGEKLRIVGPQGFFTHTRSGPSLFVGTGTGVTPLRSMLKDAIARGDTLPAWLILGVRTEEDILYRAELEQIEREHPNVRVYFTLSRPSPSWKGLTGYVQAHVRPKWEELTRLGHGTPHAYICGLQRMVGAVRDLLRKEMGMPRQHVHSERYD
jgi:ferredoxin-NADP reductase